MFGLACEICWDRNCSCTKEDKDNHAKNKPIPKEVEYTTSLPKVATGDSVFQNDEQYIIGEIINGVGYKRKITNDSFEGYTKLEGEYTVIGFEIPQFSQKKED